MVNIPTIFYLYPFWDSKSFFKAFIFKKFSFEIVDQHFESFLMLKLQMFFQHALIFFIFDYNCYFCYRYIYFYNVNFKQLSHLRKNCIHFLLNHLVYQNCYQSLLKTIVYYFLVIVKFYFTCCLEFKVYLVYLLITHMSL